MKITAAELAKAMDAEILCGDAERTVERWSFSSKDGDERTMFLPIRGERVDAHEYIRDAYLHGMRVTATERDRAEEGTEDMVYLHVRDTRDAWQRFGQEIRKTHSDIPMVSVTGSVGKTTTKEMLAAALKPMGTVLKTDGNRNGQLGVPQMMTELCDRPDCAVIEMGMSMKGEMARIAEVARPDFAVITNIGMSHIGNLGSQEAIRREKLCIVNRLSRDGILFVNGDDPRLRVLCPSCPDFAGYDTVEMYPETAERMRTLQVRAYGAEDWCEYRYEQETVREEESSFRYCHDGRSVSVVLSVSGHHNVTNATAAIAVAEAMGLTAESAAEALRDYHTMAMRGTKEILKNGTVLIDDTYNASPDSMKSGLELLCGITAKRHIAMLADILELGEHSEACHRLVGRYVCDKSVDLLITVGTDAKWIADEVRTTRPSIEVMAFDTREDGCRYLLDTVREGDAVLLKGSRGMGLDTVAKALRDL